MLSHLRISRGSARVPKTHSSGLHSPPHRTAQQSSGTPVMSSGLPPTIRQGILNLPGSTPQSKALTETLLEEDRRDNHCRYSFGLHNHLSHHLLAAYDLGASVPLLQVIYDTNLKGLVSSHAVDVKSGAVEELDIQITANNWTEFLGQDKYYIKYIEFFSTEILDLGVGEVFERYLFDPAANENGASMLIRFVSGAVHPLIQTGYAVEFGSDAMVAQALAQTAIHQALPAELFDLHAPLTSPNGVNDSAPLNDGHRQPSRGLSFLAILREAYDSPTMKPVMPYDPNAFISARMRDACRDGRPEEIRRLSALWEFDISHGQEELDEKVEELLWAATLLLIGTGKPHRKPRLDFFLMHILNAALFVPSLLRAIPSIESKFALLRALVPPILLILLIRGRPRIDAALAMSYTATPQPPAAGNSVPVPSASALGDPNDPRFSNPWPAIVASVLHAPDPHTLKAIRALYYAAQQYGRTPPGGAAGAFGKDGKETHIGLKDVDGTLFVRAAGVVMDTLGWVTHGQKAGDWDRSALGWEDAWKTED